MHTNPPYQHKLIDNSMHGATLIIIIILVVILIIPSKREKEEYSLLLSSEIYLTDDDGLYIYTLQFDLTKQKQNVKINPSLLIIEI